MRTPSSKTRRSRPGRTDPIIGCALACFALVGCNVAAGQEERPHDAPAARLEATAGTPPSVPVGRAEVTKAPSPPAACPPEMVEVADSCVDRYEAHLAVRAPDGSFSPLPFNQRPPEGARIVARSEPSAFPQAYISRVEASLACQNAGKRLCSVDEWYRACTGPERTTYPYGSNYERKRCNVGKAHLLSRFFGTNPNAWGYDTHFNNPMLSTVPGFLAKTGEYKDCVNAYGVFDMVGNVQEWVSDPADRRLAQKLPLRDGIRRSLGRGGRGVFMGGFYSTTHEHGHGCNFVTAAHEIKYHDYSVGFRCCKDAGG